MKTVTISEVREISKNGVNLILQGCGGNLEEWVNGINDLLKEAEILKEGERLDETYTFGYEGLTNLIFANIENKVNVGKLAMWRLKTRELFGSMCRAWRGNGRGIGVVTACCQRVPGSVDLRSYC